MVKVNDDVEFHMAVDGVSSGRVLKVDGAYVFIEVKLQDAVIEIERYINEVKVLNLVTEEL